MSLVFRNALMPSENQQVLRHRQIDFNGSCSISIFLFFIGILWVVSTFDYKEPPPDPNPSWRSDTPDPYYSSEEYKKFCDERTKIYNELKADGKIPNSNDLGRTKYGKRGGRFQNRISKKTGKPYRHYY